MSDHIKETYGSDLYVVVQEQTKEELTREVNHLMLNGYVVAGGVSSRHNENFGCDFFLQAMTKAT